MCKRAGCFEGWQRQKWRRSTNTRVKSDKIIVTSKIFIPLINIVPNLLCMCLSMSQNNVFFNPCHQMVFKGSFDDLVKKIQCDKLMDVHTRKIVRERL